MKNIYLYLRYHNYLSIQQYKTERLRSDNKMSLCKYIKKTLFLWKTLSSGHMLFLLVKMRLGEYYIITQSG